MYDSFEEDETPVAKPIKSTEYDDQDAFFKSTDKPDTRHNFIPLISGGLHFPGWLGRPHAISRPTSPISRYPFEYTIDDGIIIECFRALGGRRFCHEAASGGCILISEVEGAVARYTRAVAAGIVSAVCDVPEGWIQAQLSIFLGAARSEYKEVFEKAAAQWGEEVVGEVDDDDEFEEVFCLSPPRSPKGNVLGLLMEDIGGELGTEDEEMDDDDDQGTNAAGDLPLLSRSKFISHLETQQHLDPISAYTTLTDDKGPIQHHKPIPSLHLPIAEDDTGDSDGSETMEEVTDSDGGRWTSPEDHDSLVAVC